VPVLTALGKNHLAYGVLPAHYDVAGLARFFTTLFRSQNISWWQPVLPAFPI
jgi:hypothetical protein